MSVLVATLLFASSALAGGLNLAWNNCASDGGLQAKVSACLTNVGVNVLVGSFVPIDDIAGVTGIECVLDIIVGDGTSPIPPWWDLGELGSSGGACRQQALRVDAVPPGTAIYCTDWSGGLASGGFGAYIAAGPVPPVNQPAHRRLVLGFAVPLVNAADLVNTGEYLGFEVRISNMKAVGDGSCAGCSTPACIVLNDINIVAGTTTSQHLGAGTFAGSNFATWQTSGPDCAIVPTRRTTWGAVKQLYH
jgi:hypothetical protein